MSGWISGLWVAWASAGAVGRWGWSAPRRLALAVAWLPLSLLAQQPAASPAPERAPTQARAPAQQGVAAPAKVSSMTALSGTVPTAYLEGRWPVAVDAVTELGPQMFGDQINLFRGSLSFEHADLALPSHHGLTVELRRRRDADRPAAVKGDFGDWDLATPRIGGSFTSARGWQVNDGTNPWSRCSNWLPPPPESRVVQGERNYTVTFVAHDFHHGVFLDVPGVGPQEVLKRSAAFTASPSDGASYPLVTRNLWQIRCLPSVQNGPGEGFEAVSPEGVRYVFDWMAYRTLPMVSKQGAVTGRSDVYLMATEVRDRFNNKVVYRYDPANPTRLLAIEASDGRVITVGYAGQQIAWASDGTRTVHYEYGLGDYLKTIRLPDGTRWQFALENLTTSNMTDMGEGANCDFPGTVPPDDLVGTITHPSGATARYHMVYAYHLRTYVERRCLFHPLGRQTVGALWPRMTSSQTLMSKTVTGPGLPTLTWQYAYSGAMGWLPCTGCPDRKTVFVTEPDGSRTEHDYGIRWRVNEGQLLTTREGWNGTQWLRVTEHRYRQPVGGVDPFPDQIGASTQPNRTDWLGMRFRPLDRKQVQHPGTAFTWEVALGAAGFDELARPLTVTRSSTLGHSRSEQTVYHDNTRWWRIGQVAAQWVQGLEAEGTEYDLVTALPKERRVFGRHAESLKYFADGSLYATTAAGGRTTWFGDWMRGQPSYVTQADGTQEFQKVNNLGAPDWRRNAAGTTHGYGYDPAGRLRRVDYPAEPWGSYHPTEVSFEAMPAANMGLPAGHWRQRVVTGQREVVRLFDALWRKRVEMKWDSADPTGTMSVVETRYDRAGRKVFVSHPTASFTAVDQSLPGTLTEYDALGRVVRQTVDSELGPLHTTTEYLPHRFQKRVTNSRGHATTFEFQAWDTPTEDNLIRIWAPEGVSVVIDRDAFGKALAITRSGPQPGGGTVSATRRYVYDVHQRLCKTLEPETGATVQAYDAANNVAWRASGLALPDTQACNQDAVPADRFVSFRHDLLDRLDRTLFGPEGVQGQVLRSYTADGLLRLLVASRAGQNTITWEYEYWNRRSLKQERYTWGDTSRNWTFFWQPDSHGSVASLSDPMGTISYDPDAFGRPRQVSGYASGVRYHPNGQVSGYTLANGVRHEITYNLRGLPELWEHVGVSRELYRYDAGGNVSQIEDHTFGQHRSMPDYDGLDRLRQANGRWGQGRFEYDALDNLRSSTVGSRSLVHGYDAGNRLVSLTGSQSVGIGYDANGNVTQRGGQGFVFDVGNRLQTAIGKASYVYDGHGRRNLTWFADGTHSHSAYTLDGKLRQQWRLGRGDTRYVYLGDKLIAEATRAGQTTFVHHDVLGSPLARTNSSGLVTERTHYEPYGATAAGTNPTGIGFTGHVNDADTGLVYMQQRYYDPIAGRLLSVDPVVTNASNGSFFNRYVYADNNPYRFVDPDGRAPEPPSFLTLTTFASLQHGNTLEGATNAGSLTRNFTLPAVAIAASPNAGALAATAVPVAGAAAVAAKNAVAGAVQAHGPKIAVAIAAGTKVLSNTGATGPKAPSIPSQGVSGTLRVLKEIKKESQAPTAKKAAEPPPPPPPKIGNGTN